MSEEGLSSYAVRTEIIENGATGKTSRISGFGLGGGEHSKGILHQPSLETQTLLGEVTPTSWRDSKLSWFLRY